jgi:ABC-type transport system substrate-binding protein
MALTMGKYTDLGPTHPKTNREYNVTLRNDVLWHDGHIFDAYDVAFTFQSVLTPLVGVPEYSSFLIPFGPDDKANHHGNYSFIIEDKNSDNHYEFISFQLNQTYAPLELHYIGGYPILPEHILGNQTNHGYNGTGHFDPNLWDVPPLQWAAHSFNTGRTSDPGGLAGPIGTGSMVFKSFNPTTSEVSLEKFEDIWWDGDSWEVNASNDHYLIASGRLDNMTDKATIIVASLDGGLADMKVGDVNILDPQFTMSSIWEELQAESATINSFNVLETGWQALYLNPKFVQDGVYHLQKKGVRHAISHIIPREDIVEYLLNGLGIPAYTPTPVTAQLAGMRATITEADMTAFKKTLKATDGTTPLSGATTPHDKYSLDLAFDWLDTEDYDTTAWRAYVEEEATTIEETEGAAPGFGLALATLTLLGVSAYIARRRRK